MTMDERMERLADAQLHTETALGKLAEAQIRTQDAIIQLAASVGNYVEAGNERMKQLEANLDGLIRAITREHSNGKGQK
jgi:hypothetical protein